jgi:hypothetical protein
MDVIISEMTSTVRTTDSQALLNPQVTEQILKLTLAYVKQHMAHEHSVCEERKMRPSMTAREVPLWE